MSASLRSGRNSKNKNVVPSPSNKAASVKDSATETVTTNQKDTPTMSINHDLNADPFLDDSATKQQLPSLEALKDSTTQSKKARKLISGTPGDELKKDYLSNPGSFVDSYQSLKYKEQLYNINDNLLIQNASDVNNDFVCKLIRIIRPTNLELSKVLAFLEVQWYYKKTDLQSKKFVPYLPHFGENEVFLTDQNDFVLVDCINGHAVILSYEEYDSLSKIAPHTYFSRAKFEVLKNKMTPALEKWEKHCICKTPLNPDFVYVQCDSCNMWFHIACLGLSHEEAQSLETYICIGCKKKSGKS